MQMPANHYDVIVLGTGGVGSAALYHLAERGVRVIGIDRFRQGHDRGSLHVKPASFARHTLSIPITCRCSRRLMTSGTSFKTSQDNSFTFLSASLSAARPTAKLFPACGRVPGCTSCGLKTSVTTSFARRFPGFILPHDYEVVFEANAGYLLVERAASSRTCNRRLAQAVVASGETVLSWNVEHGYVTVRTDKHIYSADRLAITAGAWAGQLLSGLGLPLQVLRKTLYWLKPSTDDYRSRAVAPVSFTSCRPVCFTAFPRSTLWA